MCGLILLLTMLQVNEDKEVVLQVLIALRNLIYNRYKGKESLHTSIYIVVYESRYPDHHLPFPFTTASILQLLSQREDFISPSQSSRILLHEENFHQVYQQRR